LRSYLFVPGDNERQIAKALASEADAIILDLEDAVAANNKDKARRITGEALKGSRAKPIYVRVNALGTGLTLADVSAITPSAPDGVVLPKAEGARSVNDLHRLIMVVAPGDDRTPIIAIATETAQAMFALGDYADAHPRLAGLTWGMEDLATALGATANRDDRGEPTGPYATARTRCLMAARAAGVKPIDAVYANFRDAAGLEKQCRDAARDGFTAKMCIHPDQLGPINAAFTPSPEAIAKARRIVEAFATGKGVASLDGEMLDLPHLKSAQVLLARLTRSGS
jgi:citrate lyase subunit beta/citryl-CoA lyase